MVQHSEPMATERKPYVKPEPGEEVVIAGASGRFPECRTYHELKEKLLKKLDLITNEKRWNIDCGEIPWRMGKVADVSKFDALFFGVHYKQAHAMCPMSRMILEHAYEAIVDAGLNPKQLQGRKVAVIVGTCYTESEKTWFYEKVHAIDGFGLTGCSRAMLANRISYFLGVHGPSYIVDTACSSSFFAVEHAYNMIRRGECEAALVGGCNICLHPYISMHFARLGVLSKDGRCKTFDADADGYARSDSIGMFFLQRAKDAKRIYASIVHAKTNSDGFKDEGITFPSSKLQKQLLQDFYDECEIPPAELAYMEAHGTGTKVGDPEEVRAIDEVLTKGRTEPLKIGSIKSNLGHAEPASGVCSIAKVLIAMETGCIPANLNYKTPRESLTAITEGRLQVVTDTTPWNGGYAGLNSFGFGGSNGHVLLKSHDKEKINNGRPMADDRLARVVGVSGRTEEAVTCLLNSIEKIGVDVEYIRLLHDVHAVNVKGHLYRGYILIGSETTKVPLREVAEYNSTSRPVWFVFSGMGSQYPGMGKHLMKFPVFAKAIKKCDAVLKPRGIDIMHIITSDDKSIFDNILNSFVGIAAVQIGIVDLLHSVGIYPDNIIGHSVGELGCAYADGCFTAEQMVLSAYARGLASIETKMIVGAMAAVGLGYKQIIKLCPPDIDVACHNSHNSCTISGPQESIRAFVKHLQESNIFAKEVACSNIAYHSRYIAEAAPKLLSYLQEVIPEAKARSEKWISSSVPRSKWSQASAQYSSAEYHTNNLLSSVLFEEASVSIPPNAITIEIAPHGLLQAILKRSLSPTVANVALTHKLHPDNSEFLLQALGKLYNLGLLPEFANLYPPVQFPVSRGTPMISPHIKWEHSSDWYVAKFEEDVTLESSERDIKINVADPSYEYIVGHVIDGRNLCPATAYVVMVWETLAMMKGVTINALPVIFENIKFQRATNIPKDGTLKLIVVIHRGTGDFEIVDGGTTVVTGKIYSPSNIHQQMVPKGMIPERNDEEPLETNDFYKELKLRGYDYWGSFRSMKTASLDGKQGHILWRNNWVAFMDTMLQLRILAMRNRLLYVPTSIRKLIIDTKAHEDLLSLAADELEDLPANYYPEWDMLRAGGIEMHGLRALAIPRKLPTGIPVTEKYDFVAHCDKAETSLEEMAILSTHLALEVNMRPNVTTIEFVADEMDVPLDQLLTPMFLRILGDIPLIQTNAMLAVQADRYASESLPAEVNIIDHKKIPTDESVLIATGRNLLKAENQETLKTMISSLKFNGFLLTQESSINEETLSNARRMNLDVVLEKKLGETNLLLLKKQRRLAVSTEVIFLNNTDLSWLDKIKKILKMEERKQKDEATRLILVSQDDKECGILGFVNCVRREPGGEIIKTVMIQDQDAPRFSLTDPLYSEQLNLDLPINILQNGKWGSYRYLPLPEPQPALVKHGYVEQLVQGDLRSLRWVEGFVDPTYRPEDIAYVVYASVNFRDVMLTTGKITEDAIMRTPQRTTSLLGFEYSGVMATGQRIIGLVEYRSYSNLVRVDPYLTWEIPDHWSMDDAATVPTAYGTCYYALYYIGEMKKGEKVLIHAGTGGVGQAAIHLALWEGCEVFTTVGTPEKRRLIKELFPSIDDDHIGNSRDTTFEQLVMKQTNGRGVDIVLNSLAEDKLLASVRCLTRRGRFLEIGKYDIAANNPLGMEIFMKEIKFTGVMLDYVIHSTGGAKESLTAMMKRGIEINQIKPLTKKIFQKDEVETALRYMAAGKHTGKVLVKIADEKGPLDNPILAYRRFYCSRRTTYVIVGGLGGLGLEVAEFFYRRQVDNLVLVSRSGVKSGYQKLRIHFWKSFGVNVQVISGKDASKQEDCEYILKLAESLGPVEGIFNFAVQLKDAFCVNQTVEDFEISMKPKAGITKMLDQVSREICPRLRHFVVFSSVSCGRGTPGQCNYGFANSVMERICEKRVAEGLPGLAIEWGAVGEVGLVANMQEDNKEISIGGTLQQKVVSCMQEFEQFLLQSHPVVSSMVVAEKSRCGGGGRNPLEAVMNIMGIKDLKCVSKDASLAEIGMDSMLAVEIKQTLERYFDIYLTAAEIRNLNFKRLIDLSAEKAEDKESPLQEETEVVETNPNIKSLFKSLDAAEMIREVFIPLTTTPENEDFEVFLIPGIEGSVRAFSALTTFLKRPSACLQLIPEISCDIISETAAHIVPYILEKNKSRNNITVAGYSYGSLIATEIVRQLEEQGIKAHLLLIDGSPDCMKAMYAEQVLTDKNMDVEDLILSAIIDTIYPIGVPQIEPLLRNCGTWEEKLDVAIENVPHVPSMSTEHKKVICSALYNRFISVEKYDPNSLSPLDASITLVRPTIPSVRESTPDYGLHKVTRGQVTVVQLEGSHDTIVDNKKLADIINERPVNVEREFKKVSVTDPMNVETESDTARLRG